MPAVADDDLIISQLYKRRQRPIVNPKCVLGLELDEEEGVVELPLLLFAIVVLVERVR